MLHNYIVASNYCNYSCYVATTETYAVEIYERYLVCISSVGILVQLLSLKVA